MSYNFKYLDLKIDVSGYAQNIKDVLQISDVHNRGRYVYTEWSPEKYAPTPLLIYNLKEEFKERILSQLPKKLLDREIPGVFFMKMPKPCPESEQVPPHVDRGRRAAINIYVDCGEETTYFYDVDLENKKLNPVEQFTAKPCDVVLLDVTVPHSVKMAKNSVRSGITLSFKKANYQTICDILSS